MKWPSGTRRCTRQAGPALSALLLAWATSAAVAAPSFVPVERWLAVDAAAAPARARVSEFAQALAPLCERDAFWSFGPAPYRVSRVPSKDDYLRSIDELVQREFAVGPGDRVFTADPAGTPFGRAGARRGDRLVAVDEALPAANEPAAEADAAAGAAMASASASAPSAGAPPVRRFLLRRGSEEVAIQLTARRSCRIGFVALFDSAYAYAAAGEHYVSATPPLLASASEAELTMILAAEVAHSARGHYRGLAASLLTDLLMPFPRLTDMARNRETRALPLTDPELIDGDRLALWMLRAFGHGPAEYLAFQQKAKEQDGFFDKASYARTRPLTPRRLAALQAEVALYAKGSRLMLPQGVTLDVLHQVVAAAQTARGSAAESQHAVRPPAASGFATAADLERVPVRAEGRARFAHYLTLPSPKAFFAYESGGWRFWSGPNAITLGLDACAREQRRCWLYAVDDEIVWQADEQQRIDSRAALDRLTARP